MSASIAGHGTSLPPTLRQWGALAALLLATAALGAVGQPVARPLFVLGCAAVSWDLMRAGAGRHFAGCLILFCLAPFLRRLVDLGAGYEASGLMISGPLLAIAVPAPSMVLAMARERRLDAEMRPFLLACACAFYATVLTILDGSLSEAASGALKWIAPALYGMWLHQAASDDRGGDVLAAPTGVLLALMPALGLYGFWQYVDPPLWDRYWMGYTTIASIGQPEPYMVRVFSTMNAPAGYATFTAAALLLFGYRRASLGLLLAAAPCVLGLMLTMYRTAWIGLAAGVVLGLFHPRSRGRSLALLVAMPLLGAGVVAFTPAGAALEQRLETFGQASEDGSGQERLAEYAQLMGADGGTPIGHGFGSTDVMQAGAQALDGLFVVCWHTMGLVVGMVCVAAVLWAAFQGIGRAWRSGTANGLAIAGILVGLVVQIPLAAISSSEIGFLFWSMAALGAAARRSTADRSDDDA